MPKYLVTNGSHFEPFSYEELVRPVEYLQSVHNKAVEDSEAIGDIAFGLDRYIDPENENDKNTRAVYDSFMSKLEALRDEVYNNGGNSPEARRMMSDVRSMYSRDITRIGNAITNRQKVSDEYNKAKMSHPDLVMTDNPANAGLDAFFDDDNYGNNWYQYDGMALTNAVADDAKARTNEVIGTGTTYEKGKNELAGYLIKTERTGFTSDEVNNAAAAVRQHYASKDENGKYVNTSGNLDNNSKILYDVLVNHIDKTGAVGNVSQSELNRLIDYGVDGLSRSIGEVKMSEIKDMNYNPAPTPSGGSDDEDPLIDNNRGYFDNIPIVPLDNLNGTDWAKMNQKRIGQFENGVTRTVKIGNDSEDVTSYGDVSKIMYSTEDRSRVQNKFGGLDPMHSYKYLHNATDENPAVMTDKNGNKVEIKVEKPTREEMDHFLEYNSDVEWVKNADKNDIIWIKTKDNVTGNWHFHTAATMEFNKIRYELNNKADKFKEDNRNIDVLNGRKLESRIFRPKDEEKVRKDNDISYKVPSELVPYIMNTKNKVGIRSIAPFITNGGGDESARKSVYGAITASQAAALNDVNNKPDNIDKRFVLHKISKNGTSLDDKESVLFTDVFEDANDIVSVSFSPENISAGADGGNPIFTITSKNGEQFGGNVMMLGSAVYNTLMSPVPGFGDYNVCDLVNIMVEPIIHPETWDIYSDEGIENWCFITNSVLNGFNLDRAEYERKMHSPYYLTRDNEGKMYYDIMTPADVIKNEEFQDKLYSEVSQYIYEQLSIPRDNISLHPRRQIGTTSEKSTGLFK